MIECGDGEGKGGENKPSGLNATHAVDSLGTKICNCEQDYQDDGVLGVPRAQGPDLFTPDRP